MLEIEMKFPVADFTAVERTLRGWQAREHPAIDEADHYFNAPDRDFARTDEAFRLRCIGDVNRITYKGPKQGGPAKTRTEIELALESGPDAAQYEDGPIRAVRHRHGGLVDIWACASAGRRRGGGQGEQRRSHERDHADEQLCAHPVSSRQGP